MVLNIYEAKTQLSRLLREVAMGREVVIARDGMPLARLVPFSSRPTRRVPEMAIKIKLGKLRVAGDLGAVIESQVRVNGLHLLPVTAAHTLATLDLPMHHRDPFDRLLVAQAMSEGLTLVTGDANISRYGVDTLW